MSLKKLSNRVVIEAFCHATEDISKVKQALLNTIPPEIRDKIKLTTENLKGYFGNPIIIIRADIGDSSNASLVVEYLVERLSEDDKQVINDTLDLRIDGSGNLYLRLDKQEAYYGHIRLAPFSDDIIKMKVLLPLARCDIQEARKYLKSIGLI